MKIPILLLLVGYVRLRPRAPDENFFWENDYVSEPINSYHADQVPVIDGEIVEIDCKVRAESESDDFRISPNIGKFNANYTGTKVNSEDGVKYAHRTITVNIDNPEDIDNEEIICNLENGDNVIVNSISLQFKVYVLNDTYNAQHCDKCKGDVQIKLRRPKPRKVDKRLEKDIIRKVKRNYNVRDRVPGVFIDSYDNVCVCKPPTTTTASTPTTTTTTTTTASTTTTDPPSTSIDWNWIIPVAVIVVLIVFAIIVYIYWQRLMDCFGIRTGETEQVQGVQGEPVAPPTSRTVRRRRLIKN